MIESLKAKAEENGRMLEPRENASGLEEDWNEAEENGKMVESSENANGWDEDCNEPSANEDAENDEDIVLGIELEQKHNVIPEESNVGGSKLEAANAMPDAAVKRNAKRKKAPAGELLAKKGGGRKAKRGRKSKKEEDDEGSHSPSSPLH